MMVGRSMLKEPSNRRPPEPLSVQVRVPPLYATAMCNMLESTISNGIGPPATAEFTLPSRSRYKARPHTGVVTQSAMEGMGGGRTPAE
jgi:hypothetical protein